MNSHLDHATFRLLWRQLSTYYKNRLRYFDKTYSMAQLATLDHKTEWLIRCFEHSPVLNICLDEDWFPLKAKKPESVFCHTVAGVYSGSSHSVRTILTEHLNADTLSKPSIAQAFIDALVMTGYTDNPKWLAELKAMVTDLNALTLAAWIELYQTDISAHSLQKNIDILASQDALAELCQWVMLTPSTLTWQQLEALETKKPHLAYSVYAIWGGEHSLGRIVEGLKSPFSNEAAYHAWQFLTDIDLPQVPAMKDTATNQAIGTQTLASAEAAQHCLLERQSEKTPQNARLRGKLLAQTSPIDDAIWMHLQHQEGRVAPLLGRRPMADRLAIIGDQHAD